MSALTVRDARPDDIAAITAIYAESVANGRGTFELEAPDEVEILYGYESEEVGLEAGQLACDLLLEMINEQVPSETRVFVQLQASLIMRDSA